MNGSHVYRTLIAAAAVIALAGGAHADIVGIDRFDYADGSIINQAGGAGFQYEQTDEAGAPASQPSDWDNEFGTHNVVDGRFRTDGGGASREYNGLTEGSGATNEREGAFRGSGVTYYSVEMTRTQGAGGGGDTWGGLSTYDFGTERVFIGVPSTGNTFGLAGQSSGSTGIVAQDNVTYRLVAAVDFDTDQVKLWVNPNQADYDQRGVGTTADVVGSFTAGNWNTALRLASGGNAETFWDNLVVSTTFTRAMNPDNVFADDFSDPNGTVLDGKASDAGNGWDQTSGANVTIQNGAIDTQGGARVIFGDFAQALGAGQTLVLDFETVDTAGTFHSGGFAGISLFEGGTERIFIGDRGDATEWGLAQSGLSDLTGVVDESIVGKFLYSFDSGAYQFWINGVLEATGSIAGGFALDRLRIANNDGGDIAVSELVVSFAVPTPAALPAGLALLGLGLLRRSTRLTASRRRRAA